MKLVLFATQFLIFLAQVTHGDEIKTYNCEVVENVATSDVHRFHLYFRFINTTVCILKGLNSTSSVKHFQPVTFYPINEIDALMIQNSKVEVMTGDVCEALSFLMAFEVPNVGMTSIDEDSFEKCVKLERLNLGQNLLTSLPSRIFYHNKGLLEVFLDGNKLTTIDANLFQHNKKLSQVVLSNNNLRYLPTNVFQANPTLTEVWLHVNQLSDVSFLKTVPTSNNLTKIYLNTNHLSDVDVEGLVGHLFNLEIFDINDNEFLCDRTTKMDQFLKSRNITTHHLGDSNRWCINNVDAWQTKKLLRELQREIFHEQIESVTTMAEISRLSSENVSNQDKQLLIFIILGSTLGTLVIFLGVVGWIVKKLFTKLDKLQKDVDQMNIRPNHNIGNLRRIGNWNTNGDEYYEDGSNLGVPEPDTYDHLRFN